jgi:hypothetical protein
LRNKYRKVKKDRKSTGTKIIFETFKLIFFWRNGTMYEFDNQIIITKTIERPIYKGISYGSGAASLLMNPSGCPAGKLLLRNLRMMM